MKYNNLVIIFLILIIIFIIYLQNKSYYYEGYENNDDAYENNYSDYCVICARYKKNHHPKESGDSCGGGLGLILRMWCL